MRAGWVASMAVLPTLLAGCTSSGGDDPRAEAPSSAASSAASSAVAATASASANPTSQAPSPAASSSGPPPNSGPVRRLGQRTRLATGSTMTVFAWQRVARPGRPAAGTWWAADVGVCLTKVFKDLRDPVENIRSQFRLELTDGTALASEADARRDVEVWAQPGAVLLGGHCRRGDVVFDIPPGPRPQYFAATLSPFGWQRWRLT